jgi:CRISPR/Cas system CMR-associated protein Cmr5 small subunit
MKAVNNMLQAAEDAIKASTEMILNKDGKSIDEIYKNYTAQICVSIVQAGLVPALAYFIEDNETKEGNSSYVANALALMLGHASGQALIAHAQGLHNNKPAGRLLKQQVIHAAIALKIMMKTYHIIKKEQTA